MEKKIPIKNLHLLFVIFIGLIVLGIGSTYAVFTAEAEIVNPISFTSNLSYENNVMETAQITIEPGTTVTYIFDIVNQTGLNQPNYAIWYIDEGDSIDFRTSAEHGLLDGGCDTTCSAFPEGSYEYPIEISIRNNESITITVTIGISSNRGNIVLADNMKIIPYQEQMPPVPVNENAVTYITDLYMNAPKIINNGYNEASSVSLMNDRLGKTTLDYNGGNIRYYGANPDNYVWFNDELWRIIGVFKDVEDENGNLSDRVKIVKVDDIGEYSYDTSSINMGWGINNFATSDIKIELNELYYNGHKGACAYDEYEYFAECDFTEIGLNDTAKNMLGSAKYYLGGASSSDFVDRYSDAGVYYWLERGDQVSNCHLETEGCPRDLEWVGKVGLMYVSDYMYATNCNEAITLQSIQSCYTTNWLSSFDGWFITPFADLAFVAHFVQSDGTILSDDYDERNETVNVNTYTSSVNNIHPVVYLNSDVIIEAGTGKYNDPYLLTLG